MSRACTSCIVIPDSIAAAGHTTAVPSKNPTLVIEPSEISPSGPVSSASPNPFHSAADRPTPGS
jgi:hypothetical protein